MFAVVIQITSVKINSQNMGEIIFYMIIIVIYLLIFADKLVKCSGLKDSGEI